MYALLSLGKFQIKFLLFFIILIFYFKFIVVETYAFAQNTAISANETGSHASYLRQIKESDQYLHSLKNNVISELRQHQLRNKTYPFILFLGVTFILLFIRITTPDFYKELLSHFSKSNYLLDVNPVKRITYRISNILTDFSELLIISLLFYEIFSDYAGVNFSKIILIIGGFFLFRVMIIYPFYSIFFGITKINIHLNNIFIYNRIMFIFLLPLVFISIYTYRPFENIFQWFSLFIIALFVILRTLRIFLQIKNANNYNNFYIFLYICIFEISPFFVFLKEFSKII